MRRRLRRRGRLLRGDNRDNGCGPESDESVRYEVPLGEDVFIAPGKAGEIRMSRFAVFADAAGNDAVGTSSDGGVYSCDPRWVSSLTNGQIQSFIAEIFFVEGVLDLRFFGDHAQARRVFIEAMHGVVRAVLTGHGVVIATALANVPSRTADVGCIKRPAGLSMTMR